ncbi:MAG: TetR/AcrR family transcriptional regulator [Chloroflexota bacterium]
MKKDQRLIQSEKAIIEASIKTLLTNPSAGMSEIAQAAGVGRATLYRHFESRDALIQRLVVVCLEEIDIVTNPLYHLKGRAALEGIIDAIMPLANRFQFLMNLWHIAGDNEAVRQISERQFEEMYAVMEEAKAAGDIDADLPTVWVVAFFDQTITAAWSLVEAGEFNASEAAECAKRSFFRGTT